LASFEGNFETMEGLLPRVGEAERGSGRDRQPHLKSMQAERLSGVSRGVASRDDHALFSELL